MYEDLVKRLRQESPDIFENCRNCTCGVNSGEAADAIEKLEAELEQAKHGTGGLEMYENLVKRLREYAEWARANEYETPLCLGDDLSAAADTIEMLVRERDAVVRDLKFWDIDCNCCRYAGKYDDCDLDCEHCAEDCKCAKCQDNDHWQWRGVKDDQSTDMEPYKEANYDHD